MMDPLKYTVSSSTSNIQFKGVESEGNKTEGKKSAFGQFSASKVADVLLYIPRKIWSKIKSLHNLVQTKLHQRDIKATAVKARMDVDRVVQRHNIPATKPERDFHKVFNELQTLKPVESGVGILPEEQQGESNFTAGSKDRAIAGAAFQVKSELKKLNSDLVELVKKRKTAETELAESQRLIKDLDRHLKKAIKDKESGVKKFKASMKSEAGSRKRLSEEKEFVLAKTIAECNTMIASWEAQKNQEVQAAQSLESDIKRYNTGIDNVKSDIQAATSVLEVFNRDLSFDDLMRLQVKEQGYSAAEGKAIELVISKYEGMAMFTQML